MDPNQGQSGDNPPQSPQPTWPPTNNPPQPNQAPYDPLAPNLSFENVASTQGIPNPNSATPAEPSPTPAAWSNPTQPTTPSPDPNLPPSTNPSLPPNPWESSSSSNPIPTQANPNASLGFPPVQNQPMSGMPSQEPTPITPPHLEPLGSAPIVPASTFPPSDPLANPETPQVTNPSEPPTLVNSSQPTPSPDTQNQTSLNGPLDSAPTDLSHLIGNSDQAVPPDMYGNPPPQTQTGPTPPPPPPDTPPVNPGQPPANEATVATSNHFNISKLLIIVGVLVLLLVSGLSAYFFFGPGKSSSSTNSSIPIEPSQAPLTNPPKQSSEPTPLITAQPTASSSASSSFGAVQKDTSGSTALDLLKSRQSASPSPKTSATPKSSTSPSASPTT